MENIWQDLRYAFRTLSRAPSFSIGAAVILAIGVGATSSVFSIFDSVVRRGLPYAHSEQLFIPYESKDGGAYRGLSYPTFLDWVADSSTWRGPVDDIAFIRGIPNWVDGDDGAERTFVGCVSPRFFRLMGVAPLLGRTFLADEERRDGNRVVVLSYSVWKRYYGGDREILGRTIPVDHVPATVVGVMPRGFTFPNWTANRIGNTGMWIPVAHIEATDASLMKRGDRADLRVIARLRSESDTTSARVALSAVATRIAAVYPEESKDWTGVGLFGLRNDSLGSVSQLVTALGGAVLLVLLLACANVANLTFVRGASRRSEMAIRTALGAGRARVVRQLLTESVVIACVGCLAGLALTAASLAAIRTFAVDHLPRAENVEMNGLVVAFAVVMSFVAATLSAVVPAFRASRIAPAGSMQTGTRSSGSTHDGRIRSALVVLQLALAVVLLVGTGLFVRSLQRIGDVPLGFDPANLVATEITPPPRYASPHDALLLYQSVMERIRALPGVTDVAFVNHAPLGGAMPTSVAIEGQDVAGGENIAPLYRTVSAGYLSTMKMELSSGRWLTDDDMRTMESFVINETLERQLFAGRSAVGKRVVALRAARPRPDFGQPVYGTVVGVVRDMRANGREFPAPPEIYVPFTLETWHWGTIVARTRDVAGTIPQMREAIAKIDPAIPEARAAAAFSGSGPMLDRLVATLAQRKVMLMTVGVFALAALLLAAVGLYSVVSYGVSQRTREVGVRVALGATDGVIVRLIVGEGTRMAIIGLVIGCGAAVVLTRLIRGMLFQMPQVDLPTYFIVAMVLMATAAVACFVPARRASRLSPVEAIRGE
jgi:putative ABC transport system permease protein